MFTDPTHQKKFGVVMLSVGAICSLIMYLIRESNQPIKVTTPLGSGYMTDGWGDALPMFNMFIVAGIVMAVIGFILVLTAKKD